MIVCRTCQASLALVLFVFVSGCAAPRAAQPAQPSSLDQLAKQSLARLDGEVRVPGLTQPVQIIRDAQGIPHIYAQCTGFTTQVCWAFYIYRHYPSRFLRYRQLLILRRN